MHSNGKVNDVKMHYESYLVQLFLNQYDMLAKKCAILVLKLCLPLNSLI